MKDFNFTHQAIFTKYVWEDDTVFTILTHSVPVEIDDDGELNMILPWEEVEMTKIEPMDDYPIFYTCSLYDLAQTGWKLEFTPLKK